MPRIKKNIKQTNKSVKHNVYKITSPTEMKEVEWMVSIGDFKSVKEYEQYMTRYQQRKEVAKKKAVQTKAA